jgi:hypothetical protein
VNDKGAGERMPAQRLSSKSHRHEIPMITEAMRTSFRKPTRTNNRRDDRPMPPAPRACPELAYFGEHFVDHTGVGYSSTLSELRRTAMRIDPDRGSAA